MKAILCNLKWRRIILVSLLLGALSGAFDNQTVFGVADGCPDGEQCRSIGCALGPGGNYCVYQNIYGNPGICPTNVSCPDWAEAM